MTNKPLGEFDELVLLAIGILRDDAYGYPIKELINGETDRATALATVHSALYRLEKRGFVTSELGGATAERGGRRKRLFKVTNAGMNALESARAIRERLWTRMATG